MAVRFPRSWLWTYTILAIDVLTVCLQLGVESLPKPASAISSNRCASRCNRGRTEQEILACMHRCASLKKRSIDQGLCDYEPWVWIDDGFTPRGNARVCVDYKLDKSGKTYEYVNVSWAVPDVTVLETYNESLKYADVRGFFLTWSFGNNAMNTECRMFLKNASYFILDSTHLPPKKMNCNYPLKLLVQILPLPDIADSELREYKCPDNSSNSNQHRCSLWDPSPVIRTFEVVSSTPSPSDKNTPFSGTNASSFPHLLETQENHKGPPKESGVCEFTVCKLTVSISVAAVSVILVALVVFLVKTKRICPRSKEEKLTEVLKNESKDFCYVSYYHEDGKTGDPAKAVINLLMRSGLRTVAVNALAQPDLGKYYALGPRKFSELYMQNARCVIVIVTKKYLDLCNVNNNAELDKERRRVFEEIKYIDRAQLESPRGQESLTEKNESNGGHVISFQNNRVAEKRFIAVVLETYGLKLPTWMKGWDIYNWPKDESALLQCLGSKI